MISKSNGEAVDRSRSEGKRTPEMLSAICKLVQKGLSVSHAAEKVRVHHTTVGRWRKENPDFDAALSAAEAAFIEEQTANIRVAGKRNWQASAWLLERKWPQFFSQPQIQLHMGVGKSDFEDLGALMDRMNASPEGKRILEKAIQETEFPLLPEAPIKEKIVEGLEIKQTEDALPST